MLSLPARGSHRFPPNLLMRAMHVLRAARPPRHWRAACRHGLAAGAAGVASVAIMLGPPAAAQAPAVPPAPAAGVLTLHYQERPPYSQTSGDGQVNGLLATPAARACQRAQVPCTWARTPGQRQLALIQSGHGWDCGLGWFRNPEREALGRFSAPLYQDRPFVALVRRSATWDGQRTLGALMSDAAQPLLVKEGYSYGPLLDGVIAQHAAQVRRTSAENLLMARMLEAGRAAWMIISPEEAGVLLAELTPVGNAAPLLLHPLPGVPDGQTRHLYCNKAVPEAVIERLNRALADR
jgi:polar amino acid transport system substrate-binding protein